MIDGLTQRCGRPSKESSKWRKPRKPKSLKSLNGLFSDAGSVVVAHYSGMTVAEMGDLRSRMRAAGASFKVAKNRLAVRALEGTAVEGIAHLFKGPTGHCLQQRSRRGFEGGGGLSPRTTKSS